MSTCILLLTFLSLCMTQGPSPAESELSFFTIQYKKTASDPNLCSLDVYTPVRTGSRPVVVYVHGGGWQTGDKENVDFKPDFFNKEGFVFVSVNYRLSPEVKHPTHVQDVADAVAWVIETIDEYGGDPDTIFVMGHSAGGHLVSLLGTDEKYLVNSGFSLAVLKGVISLDNGAFDIPLRVKTERSSLKSVTTAIGNSPEIWKDASPIYHVEAGKGIPPYLLVYIASRENITGVQARNMASQFEEEGLVCEVYRAEGKTHGSLNRDIGTPGDEPTEKIMEFIRGILDGKTALNSNFDIGSDYDSGYIGVEPHFSLLQLGGHTGPQGNCRVT